MIYAALAFFPIVVLFQIQPCCAMLSNLCFNLVVILFQCRAFISTLYYAYACALNNFSVVIN
jgi:hypothetical protein